MLRKIITAAPQADYRLAIRFEDGLEGVVDFSDTIEKGGVFSPMRDPGFFARVQLHPSGRTVSWPGELEFCADALWQDVQQRTIQPA